MSGRSETGLLEAARQGDRAAFDALFAAVEAEARRVLALQLRSRPDVDPEDALQDLRIYVYEKLSVYDPAYPFPVFVRGLARTIGLRYRTGRAIGAPGDGDGEIAPADGTPDRLGQAIGVDRFPAGDRGHRVSPVFRELAELLLRDGGYPHQVLAFGFSIMVWGRPGRSGARKAGITGDPDRVVETLSHFRLWDAADELRLVLVHEGGVLPTDVDLWFTPLDERLALPIEELFRGDGRSLRLFADLHGRIAGETRLEEYFGADPRKSITDWAHGVKRRLAARMEGGIA